MTAVASSATDSGRTRGARFRPSALGWLPRLAVWAAIGYVVL
ncbi:hypothetical protein BH24ACT6_BH24ACT6_13810 [soil metagenome]